MIRFLYKEQLNKLLLMQLNKKLLLGQYDMALALAFVLSP